MKHLKEYNEFINEEQTKLLSAWDLLEIYGIDSDWKGEFFHEWFIKWANNNQISAIDKLLKDKRSIIFSQIYFYINKILNEPNMGKEIHTKEKFEKSLNTNVTIWRGGEGTYNPNYDLNRNWVSFTADRKRANTFSIYDGTYGHQGFLDKNEKYWIVELKIKLKDILLYFTDQGDAEVIIDKKLAKKAKVIIQT